MANADTSTIATLRVHVLPQSKNIYLSWQAKLNTHIATFKGFISLETSVSNERLNEWVVVQRFHSAEDLLTWHQSDIYQVLMQELKTFGDDVREVSTDSSSFQSGVTEVFVTAVTPDKEKDYREWMAKMHQVEATFPGFRGTYVQSPSLTKGGNWITLLHFDTPQNLDNWLSSKEREEVLKESEPLIASLENHRVISPYAGWFDSFSKSGEASAAWKQAMIVLLVLFPIVMLEFKFLNPWLTSLNVSFATFIGNTLSVALVTWPMVPLAIWLLGWWLENTKRIWITILGTCVVLLLYAIEVRLFWNLL